MKHRIADVIVVGGGHAGAEAAYAAARSGVRVALVTLRASDLGVMSCNPAIGGLGKGHLVREIDALGGLMGVAADRSGIQFRLLNRRKGAAVQGPRTQSDRTHYQAAVQHIIKRTPGLEIVEAEVTDLVSQAGAICGVQLADGPKIHAQAVVLTTGTFLRGVIHIGDQRFEGGRVGDDSSKKLAARMIDMGVSLGRLKTGTPPRIYSSSIDWEILETQPADDSPVLFSFTSQAPTLQQVACGITHTNARTHDLIRKNLDRSAMYGGHIEGIGPRYCPSIEDKVVRFAEKSSHQIFLEPEGLESELVYPNGISSSLPADVQKDYVRTIKGLENAKIQQSGYAIEYDYVDPQCLDATLALRDTPGLFLAGQINGTTGYEEAAAQGLMAGLNAASRALDLEPFLLRRDEAYIGVMIDDLITRGVAEPYRMFTSRAEYRLSLRADNADQRLTPRAIERRIVGNDRIRQFEDKMSKLDKLRRDLRGSDFSPQEAVKAGLSVGLDGQRRNGLELLAFPGVTPDDLTSLFPTLDNHEPKILDQVSIEASYQTYVDRQKEEVAVLKRDENQIIPPEFDYHSLSGLSAELKSKLARIRPASIAQAGRIDGMTPAALTLILAKIRIDGRRSA